MVNHFQNGDTKIAIKINEINEREACSGMLCCVVRIWWGRLKTAGFHAES